MNTFRKTNLIKKILLSNFHCLKLPYKLTFAITYKCNSKCKTCNIWKKEPIKEMSLKEIENFSKKTNFFSWFNLTGGEPFLRKDLVSIANAFFNNSPNFLFLNLTTNGTLPDMVKERVEEILSLHLPMTVVVVSLDGPEEIHDSIRGVPGSWDKAIETYKLLRDISKNRNDLQTFLGLTLSPYNLGKVEETFSSVKKIIPEIKPKDLHCNLFHFSKHYYTNLNSDWNLTQADYKKRLIDELARIDKMKKFSFFNPIQFLEKNYVKLAKKFVKTDKTPLSCKAIQTSCFIDPEGNVYPCTIYDKNLGNLRNFDYDLKEILKLDFINRLKKEIEDLKCPNCWTPCEAYQIILGNLSKLVI